MAGKCITVQLKASYPIYTTDVLFQAKIQASDFNRPLSFNQRSSFFLASVPVLPLPENLRYTGKSFIGDVKDCIYKSTTHCLSAKKNRASFPGEAEFYFWGFGYVYYTQLFKIIIPYC